MATEIKLPDLGEGIDSAQVTQVLVKAGDKVEEGQSIIEVEAEKASLEVPVEMAGTVREVKVEVGQEVKVGVVILVLDSADGEEGPAESAAGVKEKTSNKDAGADGKDSGAAESEKEARGEPEREVEAEPAKNEAADAQERKAQEKVERREHSKGRQKSELPEEPARATEVSGMTVAAAPSVRQFAREIGIDIENVPGTGPGGRVAIEDVKGYARHLHRRIQAHLFEEPEGASSGAVGKGGADGVPELPDFTRWGEVDRRQAGNIRHRIAERMSLSWSQVPHVTQHDEADITELDEKRREFLKQKGNDSLKLTITPLIVKAVATALGIYPRFRSSYDAAQADIIFKKYCHIGIAVDTDRGLLVPVLRDADHKSIRTITSEVAELASRARNGKLKPEEFRGGTFTVTNLGGIGGTFFTPIVNFPEVAILGVGRASLQPVWREAQCVPRLIMPLSLSYDHRVIDGAEGAEFLHWLSAALENPWQLLLDM